MGLSIANNTTSLNAQNNLNKASMNVRSSVEKLSSGLKINRGADGPAALVISEKQRAQIAGLKQAIENTDKAASVVQTGEGALNEINSLLVKVRSLAIDSANSGVNDDDALAANQAEITNALDTINRIANNTQFGTKKLLDGSAGIYRHGNRCRCEVPERQHEQTLPQKQRAGTVCCHDYDRRRTRNGDSWYCPDGRIDC